LHFLVARPFVGVITLFAFLLIVMCGQQEVNGNDSDAEHSVEDNALQSSIDVNDAPLSHSTENGSMRVQQSSNEKDPTNHISSHETPVSMGEILLSLDSGIPSPGPGVEYSKDRHSNKSNGTQQHVKRSNLWGRNNVSNKLACMLFLSLCGFVFVESYIGKGC
jgi:hypothetical protein